MLALPHMKDSAFTWQKMANRPLADKVVRVNIYNWNYYVYHMWAFLEISRLKQKESINDFFPSVMKEILKEGL